MHGGGDFEAFACDDGDMFECELDVGSGEEYIVY